MKSPNHTVNLIVLYAIFSTATLGYLGSQVAELRAENIKFRIIKSTIDKLTYRVPPSLGADADFIIKGADEYIVDPTFLYTVRKVENGRYLFEMGAQNISKRTKDSFPNDVDGWNFYESAYIIARQQRAFCIKNYPEFVEFLGETYPNSDPVKRKKWKKDVVKVYAEIKNPNK